MSLHDDRADDRDVRDALRALRVDPPDRGFQTALRRKLLAAGAPVPVTPWRRLLGALARPAVLWPVAGAVAGLLVLALGATFLRAGAPREQAVAASVTVLPATKVAVVRLNLTADVAVDGARIRVSLPPELSFWVDGRELPQRTFEWTQALGAGDNEIPIAVRGQRPGRYRIAVSARIGDDRVEDEIVLEVTSG
jgi:hypothetical protein